MQNSTRRDRDVVYRKQHVPRLEEERLAIMAPRKSYASTTPSIFVPINSFLDFQLVLEKAFCGARFLVCFYDREFIFRKSSAIIKDIKNMQEARPVLIAYYYFDFKDASKRGVRGLLASLLFQLGDDSDSCRDVLHKLYTSCRDGSEQPSDAALAGCLKTMLELPGQFPIFLVVDALDECPSTSGTPSPREELLDFLDDLVGSSHANLFICVTSRPEQDIQTVLNPLTPTSRQVSLHNEGGQRDDIKSYVQSFVHKDRTMRKWREEDRNLVITTLIERAGGM
jgi:hypothetical protein